MRKEKSIYTRLGGQGATLTYYARLYLGPDHLLQAASTGYSETYKRFYFRDIQAIVIRQTNLWLIWTAIALLPAVVMAIVALFAPAPNGAILWGIAAGMLIFPGFNLSLGPTCVCHIRTAVQTEQIPSLKRLRKVRRIMARIKPLIETAQAPLASPAPTAPIGSTAAEAARPTVAAPPIQEPAPPTATPDGLSHPAPPDARTSSHPSAML